MDYRRCFKETRRQNGLCSDCNGRLPVASDDPVAARHGPTLLAGPATVMATQSRIDNGVVQPFATGCVASARRIQRRFRMRKLQFSIPVRIKIAAGRMVEEIYGVEQALDVLNDWPIGRQGPVYQIAFNACFGASVDVVSTEDAGRAFTAFCRVSGILAGDVTVPGKTGQARLGEGAAPLRPLP